METADFLSKNLNFTLNSQQITDITQQAIEKSKQFLEELGKIPQEKCNFSTIMLPMLEHDGDFGRISASIVNPSRVSLTREVRDASSDATQKISDHFIEVGKREDLFKVVQWAKENEEKMNSQLDDESKRALEYTYKDFLRDGIALPAEQREKMKEIESKITKNSIQYRKNLSEDTTTLWFTDDQLCGISDDWKNGLKTKEEEDASTKQKVKKFGVSLRAPDVYEVLTNCMNFETRKQLSRAAKQQCMEENGIILEDTLKLRHELAKIMGFDNYAAFSLDSHTMAKTPENVANLLNNVRSRLEEGGKKDLKELVELKKEEANDPKFKEMCEKMNIQPDLDNFNAYDYSYYINLLKKKKYDVDEEKIREFFPMEQTFQKLLNFYQKTFHVKFVEVFKTEDNKHLYWFDEIKHYHVFDSDTNQFLGTFFLDLYPRDGKYTHFCIEDLGAHYFKRGKHFCDLDLTKEPEESFPACAMLCNFSKPTEGKPSLLRHDEVETLLHEFGHLGHCINSKTKYSKFSGFACDHDFSEVPSQFMEGYAWCKEGLKALSQHYITGESLPDAMIDKILGAKNVAISMFWLRQLFYGIFDQTVHSKQFIEQGMSCKDIYLKLKKEITLLGDDSDTNGCAQFGHVMSGGYAAGYYGYLWSKVISDDLFAHFAKAGGSVFNDELGMKYKLEVLSKGGSVDPSILIRNFIGRDYNSDAFFEEMGMKPNKE